jgi:hypothetical protein
MLRRFVTMWASWWGLLTWWTWVAIIVPPGAHVLKLWDAVTKPITRWFGASVLQVKRPILFVETGSGDGVAQWIQVAWILVLSALLSVVWIVATRGVRWRRLQDRLPALARSCVRWGVGSALVVYGVIKVFGLQMGIFPGQLDNTFGSKSPMGVLWMFMGVSPGYQALTGVAELIAGVLLFAKRTTLLGSLLGMIFMAQVFALNVFFDVPVKSFSFSLLISCVGLAFPDLGRLFAFFFLHRAIPARANVSTQASSKGGATRPPWTKSIPKVAVLLLAVMALYRPITQSMRDRREFRKNWATSEEKRRYRLYEHGIRWIQEYPDNR